MQTYGPNQAKRSVGHYVDEWVGALSAWSAEAPHHSEIIVVAPERPTTIFSGFCSGDGSL